MFQQPAYNARLHAQSHLLRKPVPILHFITDGHSATFIAGSWSADVQHSTGLDCGLAEDPAGNIALMCNSPLGLIRCGP
jgi:hypothetical protein